MNPRPPILLLLTLPLLAALSAGPGTAQSPARPPNALAPTLGPATLAADGTIPAALPETGPADVSFTASDLPDDPETAATVLADSVTLSGDRRLEAAGGVVVWYQGTRLIADRVVFEGDSERVTISGPIQLTRPAAEGTPDEAILVADSAQLDRKLRAGILQGARLVLAREMQLAAREVQLSGDGRLTTLTHVVASACRVCEASPTPLWEVRARRITHDAETRRLSFERPQFRAFGLPVAAWPGTVTAPAPGVTRARGFLRPRFRSSSKLGWGVKLPYFLPLGEHADLTLTPYLAAERTLTLEWRARAAFAGGAAAIEGAITRDDLRDGTRGYVFGSAVYALPQGFTLGAQLQAVSDRDYLSDYGHGDADRLWSGLTLERVTAGEVIALRAGAYRTLRKAEAQATLPTQVADALWRRRFEVGGGNAVLEWSAHGHRRPSDADIEGRDVARASVHAAWSREAVLAGGVLASAAASVDANLWHTAQDSGIDHIVTRAVPAVALGLRWPLLRAGPGATDQLEPHIQLVWSPPRDEGDAVADEDGLEAPLDEGSLFDLDRIPGRDLREAGLRANLGLTWTRTTADATLAVTAGRVLREDADPALPSGLGARRSDWLLAANLSGPQGLAAVGRVLLDDARDVSAAEAAVGVLRPELRLSAGYVLSDGLEEASFDGGWQIADGWWARAGARYDLDAGRPRRADLGVTWRTDCVLLEAGLVRRWQGPGEDVDTDFDLSVRLGGFGQAPGDALPGTVARRRCMR